MLAVIKAEWKKLLLAKRLWVVILTAVVWNFLILIGDIYWVDHVDPMGYRNFSVSVKDKSFLQAQEELQEASERARALWKMQQYQKDAIYREHTPKELLAIREMYRDDLQMGSKPRYAKDLLQEQIVLQKAQQEIAALEEYQGFCTDLAQNAERLTSIALASGQNSYMQRALSQQVKVYQPFQKMQLVWQPEYGIKKALQFPWTRALSLILLLFLSTQVICAEKDHGMQILLCTIPSGWRVALAKFLTLAGTQLGILLLLYGGNLVCCGFSYGWPQLSLPIQGMAFTAYSPLPCSIAAYLLLFLGMKWLAGIAFMAMSELLMLLGKTKLLGTGLVVLHTLADFVLCRFLPADGNWAILKNFNCVGLFQTERFLNEFLQQRIGESPVPYLPLAVAALLGISITGGLVFLVTFTTGMRTVNSVHRIPQKHRQSRKRHARGLLASECKKLLFGQKVIFILGAYLVFQGYCVVQTNTVITPEQSCYKNMMKGLTGWYTRSSYEQLLEDWDEVLPVWEVRQMFSAGKITYEEFEQFHQMQEDLVRKYRSYQYIQSDKLQYLKRHPGTALVYEPGYAYFLDTDHQKDGTQSILAALVLLLCFADVGEYERRTSMKMLLQTAPYGWRRVLRVKYQTCMMISVIVGLASLLPQFFYAVRAFGLPGLQLPAASLASFQWLPVWVPLWLLIAGKVILHVTGCFLVSVLITALAIRTERQSIVWVVGGIALILVPLLGWKYANPLRYIGLYAPFHLLAGWNDTWGAFWCGLFSICLLIFTWAGYEWTMDLSSEK